MSLRLDLPKLVSAIVLIATLAMAVRVPTSADTWWHLRCGEVQWRTRRVLKADVFSHTAAGQPWVNQSWLPQLAMYALYAWGGFPALALAVGALVMATFAAVLAASSGEGRYGPFWRAFVVLWTAISTGRVWAARPHLVTFVMTALWMYLLEWWRGRANRDRLGALAWLPPLMVVWANCHGGYVVGLLLLAAEIGGVLLDALWQRTFGGLWARIRPLLLIALLCALASLINPQGIRLALMPFQTLGSVAQQRYIAEWASPDFHAADLWPFLGLLLATWASLALNEWRAIGAEGERRAQFADLMRLLGFTAMALRSGRYLGLCALILAPVLVRTGAQVLSRWGESWGLRASTSRPARGWLALNWALLLLVLLAAGVKVALPLDAETIAQAHRQLFPVAAADYLRAHDLPPTLFNDYGWGGYLIWALYPHTPVFIDGRADPYGDELIAAYERTVTIRPEWEEPLKRYGVHTALIGADRALAALMQESKAWQEVYVDDVAAIFVRGETLQ